MVVLLPEHRYVITVGCQGRTEIAAKLSNFLVESGGWIVEASYYTDPMDKWFFTRQEVRAESLPYDAIELRSRLHELVDSVSSTAKWRLTDTSEPSNIVILVSKEGHCLYDILSRISSGELNAKVSAVIGNHSDLAHITEAHDIPFHHIPFPRDDAQGKAAAFAQLQELVDSFDPKAIVLSKFMQILPPELCVAWSGKALNIHHSLLPSFIGAKPYHQAHARGVKLVGATCHYVTADLDAGPIIEQDMIRVDHRDTPDSLARKGHDVEKLVLSRALRWHLEDRVLVHENHSVVF